MITIYNRQRVVPIKTAQMRADAHAILEQLGYVGYDLTVVITSDRVMRRYNKQFRHVDKATDILSFPYYSVRPGERIRPLSEEEQILGDILIAAPYTLQFCQQQGIEFSTRLRELLVHGIFHLLGYDHETDEEFTAMSAQENKMLDFLNAQR